MCVVGLMCVMLLYVYVCDATCACWYMLMYVCMDGWMHVWMDGCM